MPLGSKAFRFSATVMQRAVRRFTGGYQGGGMTANARAKVLCSTQFGAEVAIVTPIAGTTRRHKGVPHPDGALCMWWTAGPGCWMVEKNREVARGSKSNRPSDAVRCS
jgi:hypothetical protein